MNFFGTKKKLTDKEIIQRQLWLKVNYLVLAAIFLVACFVAKYIYGFEGFLQDISFAEVFFGEPVMAMTLVPALVVVVLIGYFKQKTLPIPRSILIFSRKGVAAFSFAVLGITVFFFDTSPASFGLFCLSLFLLSLLDHKKIYN